MSARAREAFSTVVGITGFGVVATGAGMWWLPLGVMIIGGGLIYLAWRIGATR